MSGSRDDPAGDDDRAGAAVVEAAPAKVNLCLHVTGRRADGYHVLDSLVVFADIADTVHARPSRQGAFLRVATRHAPAGRGPEHAAVPDGTGNLAWRALALAAAAAGGIDGVILTLEKRLPAGAGLGGGSSDAAAVLRAVAALQSRPMVPAADVLTLGADVPMCLDPRPWRARGIGERLTPVTLGDDLPAVLVWPGRPVATPAVFRMLAAGPEGVGPGVPESALALLAHDPIAALAGLRNDLEAPARRVEPMVAAALEATARLPRCRLCRMSGSGSAVFGLFDSTGDAAHAAALLAGRRPDWWVRPTTLRAGR